MWGEGVSLVEVKEVDGCEGSGGEEEGLSGGGEMRK